MYAWTENKADLLIDKTIRAEIYRLSADLLTHCLQAQGFRSKMFDSGTFVQIDKEKNFNIPLIRESVQQYTQQNRDIDIFVIPLSLCKNIYGEIDFLEGESEAARQLYNYVGLVAPTPMSVLINGASGTGKEYVAHRIHQLSKRADKPFIAIDCGSIPKELAASEFFGHVKGSFTGALNDKTGAFVEANGGTLFLDEIGNLSYEVQIQLLRALQERRIRPVGSNKEIEVNVRLISATNENLQKAIEKGNFREDLFHRINEFTLRMPSLKERQEDILLFANFFLDQANHELDRHLIGFDAAASNALQTYSWPGNLRQLKNIVKRATLLAQGSYITLTELGYELVESSSASPTSTSLSLHDEATEKKRILEALQQTGNNKSKAALLLGIDRKTLYNKLKLYNIQ